LACQKLRTLLRSIQPTGKLDKDAHRCTNKSTLIFKPHLLWGVFLTFCPPRLALQERFPRRTKTYRKARSVVPTIRIEFVSDRVLQNTACTVADVARELIRNVLFEQSVSESTGGRGNRLLVTALFGRKPSCAQRRGLAHDRG